MLRKLSVSIFITLFSLSVQAMQLSDSARISLLTNSPWDGAVYAVYGHTAIRVCDKPNGIDYVFNYGVFDFEAPNFMYRFAKGETDYILAVQNFDYYIIEYQLRGVVSNEQVLNLTQKEKQNLWDALCVNSLPENRVYRYNIFFNNCSTLPRDRVEQYVSGEIQYPATGRQQTFRDLLHECIGSYPWMRFGIDLIIGSSADRLATDREKMFLPAYLETAYDDAVITLPDGTTRKLVSEKHRVTTGGSESISRSVTDYPLVAGCVFLIVTFVFSVVSWRKKMPWVMVYDMALFFIAGAGGTVIAFLVFFSEHPATNPNWNLVWLNPVQLFIAILMPIKKLAKGINYYHFINFALLSLFLLSWFLIPQQLELAFIPYILCLWMRSGTNFVLYKRTNKSKVASC